MGFDVYMDFYDPSSGEPLDLDAIVDAVEGAAEADVHRPVHRNGHLFLIGAADEPVYDRAPRNGQ